jgi:ribonuclease P protein component
MGIPRELRIRKNKDFQIVRKEGLRRIFPYFIAQVRIVDTQPSQGISQSQSQEIEPLIQVSPPLLGVIAGRRVGNAIIRNRGKRIMRNLFLKHMDLLPAGSQLVVILRSGFEKVAFAQLENDFLQACNWFKEKSINS